MDTSNGVSEQIWQYVIDTLTSHWAVGLVCGVLGWVALSDMIGRTSSRAMLGCVVAACALNLGVAISIVFGGAYLPANGTDSRWAFIALGIACSGAVAMSTWRLVQLRNTAPRITTAPGRS